MDKAEQARKVRLALFWGGVGCGLIGLLFRLEFVGAFGLVIAIAAGSSWFGDVVGRR